jgi:hypothetical protein
VNGVRLVTVSAFFTLLVFLFKIVRCAHSSSSEVYGTWQLLSTTLCKKVMLRVGLLIGGAWLASVGQSVATHLAALLLMIAAELLGRYLFFVSVVPSNIARSFLVQDPA